MELSVSGTETFKKVTIVPGSTTTFSILNLLYPILLLIATGVLIYFIFRKMGSINNKSFDFVKNRARIIPSNTKFENVAGVDEEKEELKEIIAQREYVAVGSARLDDLNETLHLDLTSEDYDSVGGYIIEQLDRFPEEGETVVTESGVRLTADKVERTRIASVRICLPPNYGDDANEKELNNN